MSIWVKERSTAYRARVGGDTTLERFDSLHTPNAMLEWGSITKTATAALAANLEREGALLLSAPITAYLPDSRLPDSVTVGSLVSHTSGLPPLPKSILASWGERRDPYAKYTNMYFDAEVVPRLHEEHTGQVGKYVYSNFGYAVLTRIIERTVEQTWWQMVRELVLMPWGLSDVAVNHVQHLTESSQERTLRLHTIAGRTRTTWIDTGPFVGAGGLMGTFNDLEKYARAAKEHSLDAGPIGWVKSPTLWWHNGHNRDQGAFVGVSHDGSRVITVHSAGHRVGTADRIAAKIERNIR